MTNPRRLLSLVLPADEASAVMEELLDADEPRRVRAEERERRAEALRARALAGGLVVTGGGGEGYLVGSCSCLEWFAYRESEIPGVVAAYLEHIDRVHVEP